MIKILRTLMISILLLATFDNSVMAQTQTQPEKFAVKVQIVISKYQGDRKVGSAPYTLFATANVGQVSFLDGMNLPIPTGEGKISYTNVGTSITCTITTEGDNFKVVLNLDEKWVVKQQSAAPGTAPKSPASPSFRDRNYVGVILMKEGETKQLVVTANDQTPGEVVKIDITVTSDPPRRASLELKDKSPDTSLLIRAMPVTIAEPIAIREAATPVTIPFSLN